MFDATQAVLEKSLDLRMRAHEIHTSNVTNQNTPNFKAKKIDFANRLDEALVGLDKEENPSPLMAREAHSSQNVQAVEADVYEDPLAPRNPDGNTVNVDKEQVEVAKNTLAYNATIQMLNKNFLMKRLALGEGR